MENSHLNKKLFYVLSVIIAIGIGLTGCSGEQKKSPEVKKTEIQKKIVKVDYKVPEGSENWPSFRGVDAAGLAKNQQLPSEWDGKSGKNIKWVVKTPGLGLSCPVIWGNKVFLTTAVNTKDDSSLKLGMYGDIDSVKKSDVHSWQLLCYDKESGKLLWKREAYRGVPEIRRHTKSSHANSTPATDGKYIVAFFGSEGLYCYDFEGNLKWKRDFGTLDAGFYRMPKAQWEFGSSPVIHNGRVIIQCDVQKNSFLMSINIEDGKTIWKTDRDEVPTWSTPAIYKKGDSTHIVVNGYKHIGAYDFKTGKPVWWMKGGGDIPVPTPVIAFDHAYISSAHGRMNPIYSVNLESKGEITVAEKNKGNEHVTWYHGRKGAYMPTPIVYGDYLYICRDNGILTCFEAKTGKQIYKERVGGVHRTYTASAVAADGKLYFADEKGAVHIIQAGPEYKHLATNSLGESCLATPAISGKTLFVRTTSHLFAISEGGATAGFTAHSREQKSDFPEIDLSKVKKDGSLNDPAEIINISANSIKQIEALQYDVKFSTTGTFRKRFGDLDMKVEAAGSTGTLPQLLNVNGTCSKDDADSYKFTGGTDGSTYYFADHKAKEFVSGIELRGIGLLGTIAYVCIEVDYHKPEPLKELRSGKSTLKGIKDVNGIRCYEIVTSVPMMRAEVTTCIGVEDFLPRHSVAEYTMRDKSKASVIKSVNNIKIISAVDKSHFRISSHEGYKHTKK